MAGCWQSPSPGAKVFANCDGVIAPPGSIGSEISRAKVSVAGPEAVERKVLGYAHFKSFAQVNGRTPGMLNPDGVERPSVKGVRNVLSEKEARLGEKHEAAKWASAKRAGFQNA